MIPVPTLALDNGSKLGTKSCICVEDDSHDRECISALKEISLTSEMPLGEDLISSLNLKRPATQGHFMHNNMNPRVTGTGGRAVAISQLEMVGCQVALPNVIRTNNASTASNKMTA